MALKPSISLKMGQQLRMTPQLQQAIRLLQLSSLELETEIQEALDSNLMLEEVTQDYEDSDKPDKDTDEEIIHDKSNDIDSNSLHSADNNSELGQIEAHNPELDGEVVLDLGQEISTDSLNDDFPVDTTWDDVIDENFHTPTSESDFSTENYLETRNAEDATIQGHLMEQINLLNLTETDEYIALSLIDGLDENGMLHIDIQDIVDSAPEEWEIDLDEIEAVLNLIQHLDPIGIASRSLQECLSIQLRQLPPEMPLRNLAIIIVEEYILQLAARDYNQLARKLRIKEGQLKNVITLIKSLNPRPGNDIVQSSTDYIEPDVIVSKDKSGGWLVELNQKSTPKIRVNPQYSALITRGDNSDEGTQLKTHLQEAKWFIKSLKQRNDTLLKVSCKIVEYQRGFLEQGEKAMKPLVLNDIAEAVDLHESTISRVTTQKYMLTPSGLYELKYFFSSHVSTSSGEEVSSTAIRARIKNLITEENSKKPLSDSKIAKLLEAENIKVARRTIAKYRELLAIPPSNERKNLF